MGMTDEEIKDALWQIFGAGSITDINGDDVAKIIIQVRDDLREELRKEFNNAIIIKLAQLHSRIREETQKMITEKIRELVKGTEQ